jgi:hypothetical protein
MADLIYEDLICKIHILFLRSLCSFAVPSSQISW